MLYSSSRTPSSQQKSNKSPSTFGFTPLVHNPRKEAKSVEKDDFGFEDVDAFWNANCSNVSSTFFDSLTPPVSANSKPMHIKKPAQSTPSCTTAKNSHTKRKEWMDEFEFEIDDAISKDEENEINVEPETMESYRSQLEGSVKQLKHELKSGNSTMDEDCDVGSIEESNGKESSSLEEIVEKERDPLKEVELAKGIEPSTNKPKNVNSSSVEDCNVRSIEESNTEPSKKDDSCGKNMLEELSKKEQDPIKLQEVIDEDGSQHPDSNEVRISQHITEKVEIIEESQNLDSYKVKITVDEMELKQHIGAKVEMVETAEDQINPLQENQEDHIEDVVLQIGKYVEMIDIVDVNCDFGIDQSDKQDQNESISHEEKESNTEHMKDKPSCDEDNESKIDQSDKQDQNESISHEEKESNTKHMENETSCDKHDESKLDQSNRQDQNESISHEEKESNTVEIDHMEVETSCDKHKETVKECDFNMRKKETHHTQDSISEEEKSHNIPTIDGVEAENNCNEIVENIQEIDFDMRKGKMQPQLVSQETIDSDTKFDEETDVEESHDIKANNSKETISGTMANVPKQQTFMLPPFASPCSQVVSDDSLGHCTPEKCISPETHSSSSVLMALSNESEIHNAFETPRKRRSVRVREKKLKITPQKNYDTPSVLMALPYDSSSWKGDDKEEASRTNDDGSVSCWSKRGQENGKCSRSNVSSLMMMDDESLPSKRRIILPKYAYRNVESFENTRKEDSSNRENRNTFVSPNGRKEGKVIAWNPASSEMKKCYLIHKGSRSDAIPLPEGSFKTLHDGEESSHDIAALHQSLPPMVKMGMGSKFGGSICPKGFPSVSTGLIILPPGIEKSSSKVMEDSILQFFITSCDKTLEVVFKALDLSVSYEYYIETRFKVREGDHFVVPGGNMYSIRNRGKSDAKFFYSLLSSRKS